MRKNLLTGLIAVGLIAAGGTGFAMAKVQQKTQDPVYFMQEQGMGQGQMTQMMNTTNQSNTSTNKSDQELNNAFEQMLPYMKEMHPNLTDDQLKALFEQMHGQNGPCSNAAGNGNAAGNSNTTGNNNATENGMMGTSNSNL
jgi:hypothetical protein